MPSIYPAPRPDPLLQAPRQAFSKTGAPLRFQSPAAPLEILPEDLEFERRSLGLPRPLEEIDSEIAETQSALDELRRRAANSRQPSPTGLPQLSPGQNYGEVMSRGGSEISTLAKEVAARRAKKPVPPDATVTAAEEPVIPQLRYSIGAGEGPMLDYADPSSPIQRLPGVTRGGGVYAPKMEDVAFRPQSYYDDLARDAEAAQHQAMIDAYRSPQVGGAPSALAPKPLQDAYRRQEANALDNEAMEMIEQNIQWITDHPEDVEAAKTRISAIQSMLIQRKRSLGY